MSREKLGSRLGFILLSAIGIGNVWKFPYIAILQGRTAEDYSYLSTLYFC